MYEASNLFKKAISQPHRELSVRVTIDGKVYTGSDVQNCSIEESILTGEHFKFGSATTSTLDVTLLNMDESLSARSYEEKEAHVEIGVVVDKFSRPIEWVSMGHYWIEQATKEKNLIKMSGVDRMIYFEKPYVSALTYPATLLEITQEVSYLAGIELITTDFLNCDYVVSERPELNITLRKALEYISELACGFACINRSGKLEIVSFTETDLTIDRSNYYSMNLSEYEYTVDRVVINNEGIIEEKGTGSNILEIKDNIFSFNNNETLLTNIYINISGFTFKPFKSTWQGNVLTAPGDIINVSYKDGQTYKSFISKQKFTFDNGLKCNVETNAKTKMQVDFQTRGSVTNDLKNTKAEIKNLGDEINLSVTRLDGDIAEAWAEISITADAITSEVGAREEAINGVVSDYTSLISQTAQEIRSEVSAIETTLDGKITDNSSSITQTASQIRSEVTTEVTRIDGLIDTANSAITQTASDINLRVDGVVSDLEGIESRVSSAELKITDSKIISTVTGSTTYQNDLNGKVNQSTYESKVTQLENSISSKVSASVAGAEEIFSLFEQTASTIKMSASKIDLDGIVRVNSSLSIGDPGSTGTKLLRFRNQQSISAPNTTELNISSLVTKITDGDVWIGDGGYTTHLGGNVDFSGATTNLVARFA